MEAPKTSAQSRLDLSFKPHQVAVFLAKAVAFVVICHAITVSIEPSFVFSEVAYEGIYKFFNMGAESNLPTFVSTLNLIIASLLSGLVAKSSIIRRNRSRYYWWGITFGLFLMGLDESAMIHESLVGETLKSFFNMKGSGIFYYGWYVFYIPIMAVLGGLYIPFLKRLPLRYSVLFSLSAVIYFGGAIGVEMLESYLAYKNYALGLSVIIEETMEMLGIVILIYALLLYLSELGHVVRLQFSPADKD